jgi:hypothetical protein
LLKLFHDKRVGPEKGRFIALSLLTVWRVLTVYLFVIVRTKKNTICHLDVGEAHITLDAYDIDFAILVILHAEGARHPPVAVKLHVLAAVTTSQPRTIGGELVVLVVHCESGTPLDFDVTQDTLCFGMTFDTKPSQAAARHFSDVLLLEAQVSRIRCFSSTLKS